MAVGTGTIRGLGPVAQLVEHRVYTAGVVGSSPAGPTDLIQSDLIQLDPIRSVGAMRGPG